MSIPMNMVLTELLAAVLRKYSDDQPRGDDGRWSSGGDSGGGSGDGKPGTGVSFTNEPLRVFPKDLKQTEKGYTANRSELLGSKNADIPRQIIVQRVQAENVSYKFDSFSGKPGGTFEDTYNANYKSEGGKTQIIVHLDK